MIPQKYAEPIVPAGTFTGSPVIFLVFRLTLPKMTFLHLTEMSICPFVTIGSIFDKPCKTNFVKL